MLAEPEIKWNAQTNNRRTGFILACANGKLEVVKRLLQDPNIDKYIRDEDDKSGHDWAVEKGHVEMARLILQDAGQKLISACRDGDLKTVLGLLVVVENSPAAANQGFIVACSNGHHEIVKKLLELPNIDLNAQDSFGGTGFRYACAWGKLEVVDLLLSEPKVKWNVRNKYGRTGFNLACRNGKLDVVKRLLQDPNIDQEVRDEDGKTGYEKAVEEGESGIADLIRQHNASK